MLTVIKHLTFKEPTDNKKKTRILESIFRENKILNYSSQTEKDDLKHDEENADLFTLLV